MITLERRLARHLQHLLAPLMLVGAACSGGEPGDDALCDEVTSRSAEDGELSREPGYLQLAVGASCPEEPPVDQLGAADCCPVMEPEASCGLVDEQTTTAAPFASYGATDTAADEPFVLCTYDAVFRAGNACCGRPLRVEGATITARHHVGPTDWSEPAETLPAHAEARDAALRHWRDVAAMEHASVASFGQVALELLRHGAPADLVARCHQAALDEVHHAKLAYGLVSALTGEPVGPAALPLPDTLPLAPTLAAVTTAVVHEGCIGETLASIDAAARLVGARGAVADALATIVDDEARHAGLAWATLRWLLAVGGEPVRLAAAAAFAEGVPTAPQLAELPKGGRAWGLLDDRARDQVLADGFRQVVRPAWEALRAGSAPAARGAEA